MIPVHELRKYDIFLDLEPNELASLARIADVVHASEGEAIIEEGQPARTFYVMDQGNLMVAFKDGRALTLHGRGEVVGWSAIVHPTHYTCHNTLSDLAGSGIEVPPIDSYLGELVSFMKKHPEITSEAMV